MNEKVIQLESYTDFDLLYKLLEEINLRMRIKHNNRVGFPVHRGAVFGIVRERFSARVRESLDTRTYPLIWEELKRIGNTICPFKWKTVYINKN